MVTPSGEVETTLLTLVWGEAMLTPSILSPSRSGANLDHIFGLRLGQGRDLIAWLTFSVQPKSCTLLAKVFAKDVPACMTSPAFCVALANESGRVSFTSTPKDRPTRDASTAISFALAVVQLLQ